MRAVSISITLLAASLAAQSIARVLAADPTADAAKEHSLFAPTISNRTPAPGRAPEGMVWIPGGEFSMGNKDYGDLLAKGWETCPTRGPFIAYTWTVSGWTRLM